MTARLFAASSGTDCDWVVRLIDVYPEDYPDEPDMGGYQLLVSGEPFRARFRNGFEKPIVLFSAYVGPDLQTAVRELDLNPVSKVDTQAVIRMVETLGGALA